MTERCLEAELYFEAGEPSEAAARERWQEHLAGCSSCRAQVTADHALRRVFNGPPVVDDEALARALRRALAHREFRARRASKAKSGRSVRWILGTYAAIAAGASLWLILRVPWSAVPAGVPLMACAIVSLLVPAVLFDRTGILRPPS